MSNKKSWKEKQQERLKKHQDSEEARKKRREAKTNKKSKILLSKKNFIVILIIILTVSIVVVWQLSVKNFTIIYIRSDGTVDPESAALVSISNEEYEFTSDIFGSLVIQRDDIVIDGNNFLLYGDVNTNSTGIELVYISGS